MTEPGPRVEVLFYVGCPAYRRARERALRVLDSMGLPAEVTMTRVRSHREALALGFPGSPTIRVDGADIQPEVAARRRAAGLVSREYAHDGRREDIPPEALLRAAIEAALKRQVG